MCRPTPCKTCGKTTWAGCGQHVAKVQAGVPAAQWCPGHDNPSPDNWLQRLLKAR